MRIRPVSVFNRDEIYTRYRCVMEFQDKVYGGRPRDPKLIEAWVRTHLPDWATDKEVEFYVKQTTTDEAMARLVKPGLAELTADEKAVVVSSEYASERHTNGFDRDLSTGLPCLGSYQVRAMLREAVAVNYPWDPTRKANWKNKTPRDLFIEYVAVTPLYLPVAEEKDIEVDMCIGHIKGKYGRLSTLTYVEYVRYGKIEFEVLVLDDFIKPEWWNRLWPWSEVNGVGARRSMGAGTFAVTTWERVGKDSGPVLQSPNGLVREAEAALA